MKFLLIFIISLPSMASIINESRLSSCHADLQKIVREVSKYKDVVVIECHRGKTRQNKLFKEKKTLLKYPKSKHNRIPSNAVDIVPHPIDWKDIQRLREFANFVKGVAIGMGINLTSGGLDWEYFPDYPHFEIKEDKSWPLMEKEKDLTKENKESSLYQPLQLELWPKSLPLGHKSMTSVIGKGV